MSAPVTPMLLSEEDRNSLTKTRQRLRRGVFCSVRELVVSIDDFLVHHNADPKPFVWSTTVEVSETSFLRTNIGLDTR